MDIVSQKQAEIQQLKDRLFQLQRLNALERQQQMFAEQMMEVLRQQNIHMKKTIEALKNHQAKLEELDHLKIQINDLRRKNVQLEQAKSNLCSQIINVQTQVFRVQEWNNRDLSRTNWGDSMIDSRRGSETNSYREQSSFVAPSLIDSRYTSNQNQNQDVRTIHEEVAHPIHVLTLADWNARVSHMTSSHVKRIY